MLNTTNEPANTNAAETTLGVRRVMEIRTKARVWRGQAYGGELVKNHHAEIKPGAFVRLFGIVTNRVRGNGAPYDVTFRVGDTALYGRMNLDYEGKIVSITAKRITVSMCGGGVRSMDLAEFDRLNWDYSAEKTAKRNAEWMD